MRRFSQCAVTVLALMVLTFGVGAQGAGAMTIVTQPRSNRLARLRARHGEVWLGVYDRTIEEMP